MLIIKIFLGADSVYRIISITAKYIVGTGKYTVGIANLIKS